MSSGLPNYDDRVQAAVVDYWDVRRTQAERSRELGVVNTGLRAEVTCFVLAVDSDEFGVLMAGRPFTHATMPRTERVVQRSVDQRVGPHARAFEMDR